MIWNDHHLYAGSHAFLSASKHSWLNYDKDRLVNAFFSHQAVARGTKLHEVCANLIDMRLKLPKSHAATKLLLTYEIGYHAELSNELLDTITAYVNDAIGFKMESEQILFYSPNCFGTADAISYDDKKLRIHDLKTGSIPAHIEQLEIYAALFCLEYDKKPGEIDMELRIYQGGNIASLEPEADDILPIMDKIIQFDKYIDNVKKSEGI